VTKLRHPGSIKDGIWNVLQGIGRDAAAFAVGLSWRRPYEWADPDVSDESGLEQVCQLDAAHLRITGKGTPIIDAMRHRAEKLAGVFGELERGCPQETMRVIREVTDGVVAPNDFDTTSTLSAS
jgi:hypothetical protein